MTDEEKKAIGMLKFIKNNNSLMRYKPIDRQDRAETILNLIEKQEKIINEMAEYMEDELTIDDFCTKENCYADEYVNGHCQKCLNCIIEYFEKKVGE